MDSPLLGLNQLIKKEADKILNEGGLIDILNFYGTPHIQGSYALDLMTWRDLDIYLEGGSISESVFFEMGSQICTAFNPVKMSFRNERISKTPGLPKGLYWGIYLGNERAGAWKIDIWSIDSLEFQKLLDYHDSLQKKLTTNTVLKILEIKSKCWMDPEYRRSFNSSDIYRAVLENNVEDIDEFKNYLKTRN